MQNTVRETIAAKYHERRLKNASYSLRAFSESIGISSGALTAIIHGKRKISKKMAERLSVTMKLSKFEKEQFLSCFNHSHRRCPSPQETQHHSLPTFELIARWQYFAILSILKIKNVKWTTAKVALKLGLSESECNPLLANLRQLGLITEKNGFYFRSLKPLEFGDEIPSWAIKASHTESLELARKALHEVPMELRNHSSMTMAINIKHLVKAKEKIRQFELEMAELLESGSKSEIYRLNVQLFPLLQTKEDLDEK